MKYAICENRSSMTYMRLILIIDYSDNDVNNT